LAAAGAQLRSPDGGLTRADFSFRFFIFIFHLFFGFRVFFLARKNCYGILRAR